MANYGTILVVDDNTSIFTTLEICLDGVFERILTLTKPDGILTTLEQEAVDIILLDMNFSLGVNNGQEGLLWVQAVHRRHPNIPIVLMTAYADVKLAVKGLKSGAVDFVTKPWDNHELVRVLKDAIDSSTEVVSLEKGVRAINDAAGNLVTFVDSYRKLTQLQEPVISTLRLKDFLEGIMELYPNITWKIGVPADTALDTDESLLRQVIVNIIKNAAEAGAKNIECSL